MGGIQISVSGSAAGATDNLAKLSTEWEKQAVVPTGITRTLKKVGIFGNGTNFSSMRVYKGNKLVATITSVNASAYDPLKLMSVYERFMAGDVITVELMNGSGGAFSSQIVVLEWNDVEKTSYGGRSGYRYGRRW